MWHWDLKVIHYMLERLHTDLKRLLGLFLTTVIESRRVHIRVVLFQLSPLRPDESVVLSEHNYNRN